MAPRGVKQFRFHARPQRVVGRHQVFAVGQQVQCDGTRRLQSPHQQAATSRFDRSKSGECRWKEPLGQRDIARFFDVQCHHVAQQQAMARMPRDPIAMFQQNGRLRFQPFESDESYLVDCMQFFSEFAVRQPVFAVGSRSAADGRIVAVDADRKQRRSLRRASFSAAAYPGSWPANRRPQLPSWTAGPKMNPFMRLSLNNGVHGAGSVAYVEFGESAEIAQLVGVPDHVHRLRELGMHAGQRVEMVQRAVPASYELTAPDLFS